MYNAFISYSHSADDRFAPALQDALQKFAKPSYKKRSLEIFRDESSLSASPQLSVNIKKELRYAAILEWNEVDKKFTETVVQAYKNRENVGSINNGIKPKINP